MFRVKYDQTISWLKIEPKGFCALLIIFFSVLLAINYSIISASILCLLNINLPDTGYQNIQSINLMLVLIVFANAMKEEILFRLPLAFLTKCNCKNEIVITSAIFSSVLFGFIHGSLSHIFVQGVVGFCFCFLFLKCGGWQNNFAKALTATTGAHFLLNMFYLLSPTIH